MMGLPALRQAVAAHDRRFYGLDVDWQTEVLVTSGATEALLDCFLGLLEPGDEVVLLEPAYDTYAPVDPPARRDAARGAARCRRTGRCPRDALAAAFTPATKLRRPQLADEPRRQGVHAATSSRSSPSSSIRHDAYVVCDEVYEHLVFDDARHVPLMTLPGMRDAHRADRLGRQDVLAHRLEGRLHHGAGRDAAADHQGASVRHVHDAAQPAARRRARPRRRTTRTSRRSPTRSRGAAIGSRPAFAALGLPLLPCDGTYFLVADVVARGCSPGEDDVAFCASPGHRRRRRR